MRPNRFPVATGDVRMQGVLVDIQESSGQALSVELVSRNLDAMSGSMSSDSQLQ